ncbi:MAG: DUF4402 domain-containing protein [Holophagaceae bacterium]|nr:DUF4402 domain-containing protein [Holophagaceae bacterium]
MNTSRLLLPVLLSLGPVAFSQASATASSNVGARILRGITLTNTAPLEFGQIVSDTVAQTVTVSTAGARSSTGPAANLLTGAGPFAAAAQAAGFTATGSMGHTSFAITLPASTTVTNGTDTRTVDTFVSSVGLTSTFAGGTFPTSAGTRNFTVGANLVLTGNETEGDYVGTFDVTVAYN